jgi:hypothetical protein
VDCPASACTPERSDLVEQFAREAGDDLNVVVHAALDRVEGVNHRCREDTAAKAVALEQERARAGARGAAGGGDAGTAGAADDHVVGSVRRGSSESWRLPGMAKFSRVGVVAMATGESRSGGGTAQSSATTR